MCDAATVMPAFPDPVARIYAWNLKNKYCNIQTVLLAASTMLVESPRSPVHSYRQYNSTHHLSHGNES
jgi:hypothetical protein